MSQRGIQYLCPNVRAACSHGLSACLLQLSSQVAVRTMSVTAWQSVLCQGACAARSQWILASLLQLRSQVAERSMATYHVWHSILVSKCLRNVQSMDFGLPAAAERPSCSVHGVCPSQRGIQYLCPNVCAAHSQCILASLLQRSSQVAVWRMSVKASHSTLVSRYVRSVEPMVLGFSAPAQQPSCSVEYVCPSLAFNTCIQVFAQRAVSELWLLCYSPAAQQQCGVCLSQHGIQYLCPSVCAACSQWSLAILLQPSSQVAVWTMSITAWH